MAIIDSPSGSSWSEIKAEINDKALNKQGDTITGDIVVDSESGRFVTDEVTDTSGESAISMIPDAQTLLAYGVPINTFTLTSVSVTTSVNSDGENEAVIPMSYPAKRAILVWGDENTSSRSGFMFINEDESQAWGLQVYHGGTCNVISPLRKRSFTYDEDILFVSQYLKDNSIYVKFNQPIINGKIAYVLF